ncbi:MAG: ABC transporter permease [Gemmatimonadaceae bacterium]|nr:ABC transporter permease [Gemmatimonadaceae bacterium]
MSRRGGAWQALMAFMRKEVRHLLRDRRTLAILLLLPLAQLLLFGFAVRTDITSVRVGVVAPAPDAAAAALRARFEHGGRFLLLPPIATAAALEPLLRAGRVDVGVVLEPAMAASLAAGQAVRVLVVADAVDPNTGTMMQNYASAVLRDWQASLGAAPGAVTLETRVRMRFNPTLESVNLFVPGLIALILTMVTSLMTAISLSREKEQGTFELLLVSPLHPWQIIIGKVLPYLALAMANVVTVLLAAWLVFGVPFRGSVVLLLAASMLFALVGLAVGVLIAAVTSSQLAAMLAALGGMMLPNTMLSGLIFPVASMPRPLQFVTGIVPARWFIEIVRGIMLKGVGVSLLWPQLSVLLLMLVVLLALAIRRTSVRLS